MKNKTKIFPKSRKAPFTHLLKTYARPFWPHIIGLIFLSLFANIFTATQPIVLSGIMEVVMEAQGTPSSSGTTVAESPTTQTSFFNLNQVGAHIKNFLPALGLHQKGNFWQGLKVMLGLYLITVFLASLLNFIAQMTTIWIHTRAELLIREDVLRHILSLNLGFFHKQKSGELISRVVQDAQNTGQGIGPLVRSCVHHTVLIIIYSIYLFSTSVWMTLAALAMILMQFGLSQIIKRPIRQTTRALLDRFADYTTTLQETFTGIRVIKSFGAEKYEMDKLTKDSQALRIALIQSGRIKHLEPSCREFLDSVAMVGIIAIASLQLVRGSLSLQGFLLFIFVGRLLIEPINKFSVNFTWAQALMASYERIDELLSIKPQVLDGHLVKNNFLKNIELRKVTFIYQDDPVLDEISLTLNRGEVLAIVGPSGAGKSTLTDLVLRFYDPQHGEIFIDGINLRDVQCSEYRKIFGVVPQESLLFNDTIANNIRYGRKDISDESIEKAARIANAHEFIRNLPQGYNTFVGDRGVRLSGGERQRVAIARAIVASPEILIFDEATSSLDTDSEKQVQTAVDRVLEMSTAIVIAHRLSTILHADKIVVLNDGRIEAIGKHAELLEKSETYRRLYNLQFDVRRPGNREEVCCD